MSKPRKPFPLRMDPELFDALQAWAAQEMRSINGQIEFVLRDAVKRWRKGNPRERKDSAAPGSTGQHDEQT